MTPFKPRPLSNPDHVDRAARHAAALLLRRFAGGAITNDNFEDHMPATSDPAIAAIWNSVWCYYSDVRTHSLSGRDRLHPDLKRVWIRWILFLDSDNKYEWPEISDAGNDPVARDSGGIGRLLKRILFREDLVDSNRGSSNDASYGVWPFFSQQDYRAALRQPRRLAAKD